MPHSGKAKSKSERDTPSERRGVGKKLLGLQGKVVGFLLIIAMVPLVVAGLLINQSARVAHNFASNETAFLRPPLDKAKRAYIELIETKRDLYYPQVALRLAALPTVVAVARGQAPQAPDQTPQTPQAPQVPQTPQTPGQAPQTPQAPDPDATSRQLDELLAQTRELAHIIIRDAGGVVLAERQTLTPAGVDANGWRPIPVTQPIPGSDATLELIFAASTELQSEYATLTRTLQDAERIDEVRSALPSSYRNAFLLLVGGVVLLVSITGIWLGRRFARRIFALLSGTRRVAAGDMQARVHMGGHDELTELAHAFNRMVEELEHDQEQIAYLQRVGAWQDVARKLAHEIKNPLTPIQLAVQQCVSSYQGDDARFKRLLGDAEEIVTEEIANLRRLVDAFRTLGQLPRVEPMPMPLVEVVEDLRKDPMLIDQLEIEPPDEPVMIRGDRLLLRRVLTNLVENGVHAGRESGKRGRVLVRWHVEHEHERVRLIVDDEGPGVPEDRRGSIFEPYITHKEDGTGLGLTISKKIALEHGGSLSLAREPSALGGARFVLTLPIGDADA